MTAVAMGRSLPPKDWFEEPQQYEAAKITHLNSRLADMVRRNTPRGYR